MLDEHVVACTVGTAVPPVSAWIKIAMRASGGCYGRSRRRRPRSSQKCARMPSGHPTDQRYDSNSTPSHTHVCMILNLPVSTLSVPNPHGIAYVCSTRSLRSCTKTHLAAYLQMLYMQDPAWALLYNLQQLRMSHHSTLRMPLPLRLLFLVI